jgi:hypothetical protein
MVAVGDVLEWLDQVPVLALALADELNAVRASRHRGGNVGPELDQVARATGRGLSRSRTNQPPTRITARSPFRRTARFEPRAASLPTASDELLPSAVDSVTVIDGASRP